MVEIRPVPALCYGEGRDLDRVTTPPYDVVPAPLLAQLRAEPESYIHVVLPEGEGNAKYERAARTLRDFVQRKVLTRRPPAYYAYAVTYSGPDGERTATGFFALLRLDPEYKVVKPHEKTHRGPKEDRLKLYRATRADTEPIQLLVPDPDSALRRLLADATSGKETMRCTDHEKSVHRVWRLNEEAAKRLEPLLAPKSLYIADGHHRYETSFVFAREQAKPGPWDFKLVGLFPLEDSGIMIYPTHRLLRGLPDAAAALKKLDRYLPERHPSPGGDAAHAARTMMGWVAAGGRRGHCFGVLTKDSFQVVTIAPNQVAQAAMPQRSQAWRSLDVSVLHHAVLPAALGVTEENAEMHLRYTRVPGEAVEAVRTGEAQLAILMNPTRVEDVRRVADAGEVMPQKSTYFMPKLRSGLLCYPFE